MAETLEQLFDRVMRDMISTHGMPEKIVHGANPRGLDAMAGAFAQKFGIEEVRVPADWNDLSQPDADIKTIRGTDKRYDAKAGPRRNTKMLADNDVYMCISFPGEWGTLDMTIKALNAKVNVFLITASGLITTVIQRAGQSGS